MTPAQAVDLLERLDQHHERPNVRAARERRHRRLGNGALADAALSPRRQRAQVAAMLRGAR